MANNEQTPEASPSETTRRDLFKKLGAAAYVAPATLVLLSSERANAY